MACVSALLAALLGFSLSVPFDLPSGPTIIAVSGILTLLAWAVRRLRRA
jgi:ABC-type Mn2+/Zn2+ transport system permease subunit